MKSSWVKITRFKGSPIYVKTPYTMLLQAVQFAMDRIKYKKYSLDKIKKMSSIQRPPRNKRGAIIIDLPLDTLRTCPECGKLILDTNICISCGEILSETLKVGENG